MTMKYSGLHQSFSSLFCLTLSLLLSFLPKIISADTNSRYFCAKCHPTSTSTHFSNMANRKRMDRFNRQLVQMAGKVRQASSFEELDKYDSQLGEFFGRIIDASEQGKINAQEFAIFKFAFQATEDAIRDREYQLRRSQGDDRDGEKRRDDDFRPRNRMTKVS